MKNHSYVYSLLALSILGSTVYVPKTQTMDRKLKFIAIGAASVGLAGAAIKLGWDYYTRDQRAFESATKTYNQANDDHYTKLDKDVSQGKLYGWPYADILKNFESIDREAFLNCSDELARSKAQLQASCDRLIGTPGKGDLCIKIGDLITDIEKLEATRKDTADFLAQYGEPYFKLKDIAEQHSQLKMRLHTSPDCSTIPSRYIKAYGDEEKTSYPHLTLTDVLRKNIYNLQNLPTRSYYNSETLHVDTLETELVTMHNAIRNSTAYADELSAQQRAEELRRRTAIAIAEGLQYAAKAYEKAKEDAKEGAKEERRIKAEEEKAAEAKRANDLTAKRMGIIQ